MQKKAYASPKLTEYGKVKELTLANRRRGYYCDRYGRRTSYYHLRCGGGGYGGYGSGS